MKRNPFYPVTVLERKKKEERKEESSGAKKEKVKENEEKVKKAVGVSKSAIELKANCESGSSQHIGMSV